MLIAFTGKLTHLYSFNFLGIERSQMSNIFFFNKAYNSNIVRQSTDLIICHRKRIRAYGRLERAIQTT